MELNSMTVEDNVLYNPKHATETNNAIIDPTYMQDAFFSF